MEYFILEKENAQRNPLEKEWKIHMQKEIDYQKWKKFSQNFKRP